MGASLLGKSIAFSKAVRFSLPKITKCFILERFKPWAVSVILASQALARRLGSIVRALMERAF